MEDKVHALTYSDAEHNLVICVMGSSVEFQSLGYGGRGWLTYKLGKLNSVIEVEMFTKKHTQT